MSRKRNIILGLSVPLFTAVPVAFSQNVAVSVTQQLELKTRYAEIVERAVKNELASQGFESSVPPLVTVKLEFDQKRLADDAAKFASGQQDAAMKRLQALMESTTTKTTPAEAEAQVIAPASNGLRFGRLNVDLNREALGKLLSRKEPEGAKSTDDRRVSVSLQMPDSSQEHKAFRFDPADYLIKASIDVMIADGVPSSFDETVKARIVDALNLAAVAGDKAAEWIKVGRLPKVEAKAVERAGLGDWVGGLFSPNNSTLALIFVGVFLSLCMLLAAFLMAKMFGKVADGIKDLKPVAEKAEGGERADAVVAEAETAHAEAAPGHEGASGRRHEHDPAASVQALTSEMTTIRDQLLEIVRENDKLFAELLRDLYYQPHGLEDIRDLLSFAGYKAIRPALEKLPKQSIEQLQAFVEDSGDEPVSLLHGVEVAQRLYRACISKISGSGPEAGDLDRLSTGLVAADDAVITQVIPELSGQQLAFLLRTLSVSRGNSLIRSIPSDKLRDATTLLDKMPENAKEAIDGILGKIQALEGQKAKKSNLQVRFVLRLARNASIAEESGVLEMVGPEEWDFKLDLMRTKFFYSYVKYLPTTFVRSILDGVPVRTRAEILHVADDALRTSVLSTFQEGSKLKEMLQTELDQITKNAKRKAEIEKNRVPTLEAFMSRLRAVMVERPELLDQVIIKQCEVEKLTPPPRIKDMLAKSEGKAA